MVSEKMEKLPESSRELITELIVVGKKVVERGLVVGSGGNLSCRMPGENAMLVTATGTELDQLDENSFVKVGLDGVISEGTRPSSEFRVHLESYKARPDINVCIHLHPQASVLTAALDIPIRFVTIDHVYYVRKVVRVPWIRSGSQEIADATAHAMTSTNVVILENHGCVVLAPNVALGFSRVLNLEEAAELTLKCKELGVAATEVPKAYWDYLSENNL